MLSADADYASEANFAVLEAADVCAVIALRRYHHDEPPGADSTPARSTNRRPQTVEPVFSEIKAARRFR